MRSDARKLHQAVRKRQASTPSREPEGFKRVQIIATPSEVLEKENTLIMVRTTSNDDDVPLVDLQPRASPINQPSGQPSKPSPTVASSS